MTSIPKQMATKTVLLRLGQAVDTTVRCSRDISYIHV
jgi:hypothetical protein